MNKQVLFAQVEPTTKCNFTCGFCCGRSMDQSDLSLDKFKKFLDLFPEIQYMELQGEGEPLIHPQFFEMVEIASQKGIHISFITNGSLLTPQNVQRILNSNIAAVRISLETTDPAKFKQIRGGSLENVQKGIARLLMERSRLGLTYPSVGIALTVLASTLQDLPKIFQFYMDLGMDGGIAIQSLNRMPQYSQFYSQQIQGEYLEREQHEAEYQRYMSSEDIQKIWQEKSAIAHFYDQLFEPTPEEQAQGKLTNCPWLRSGINLDRHGRLTPCCMVKGESWSFGTLLELSKEELLQKRTALAQELTQGQIPEPCQGCKIAQSIIQGSVAKTSEEQTTHSI